jgi:D-alanyl-D-alanine carboxypeptidase (penicillin-binding protein 5/6)
MLLSPRLRPALIMLLAAIVTTFVCLPARALADSPVEERFAAIVIDAQTGETLFARHADARRYPASLTKVMTLYLAFDALDAGRIKLADPVVISRRAAARPPSRLGLRAGERMSLREAMDVLVVKSANDVATALAERLGGDEAAFARAMTRKAKQLGLAHTQFRNASGLPQAGHFSTARDLALLGRAFLRDHPDDYAIFDQEQTVFRGRLIRGHNRLLARPGIDGFKTGFVNASGYNLLTSGVRDGRRVIAVVLGGRSARSRDAFMAKLLQASFSSLAIRSAGFELTVADLMAEPAAPLSYASAAPIQTSPLTIQAALAQAEPARSQGDASPTASEPSQLWVQVGAFRSKARSQARLADIVKRHPRRFGPRPRDVARIGGLFAARFGARSAKGADAACALLTAEGEDCLVLTE